MIINISGSFEAPPDATGNTVPRSETLSLLAATLTAADGSTLAAYTAPAPTSIRVIDRPQIIIERDLTTEVGTTFTGLTVQFDPSVSGVGEDSTALATTLTNPLPSYSGAMTVVTNQQIHIDILMQWQNTVTRATAAAAESLSSPAFELDLSAN